MRFLKIILSLALIGGGLYWLNQSFEATLSKECAFCNPAIIERQSFYEDELVIALFSYRPVFPGHALIIPKRHVERFEKLTEEEIAQIGRVVKKVDAAAKKVFGTSPYLLHQKNGVEVGQTVPHVHVHYLPKKIGDGSVLNFIWHILASHFNKPLSSEQLQQLTVKMRAAIESAPKEENSRL